MIIYVATIQVIEEHCNECAALMCRIQIYSSLMPLRLRKFIGIFVCCRDTSELFLLNEFDDIICLYVVLYNVE